jgi:hypothetical protein
MNWVELDEVLEVNKEIAEKPDPRNGANGQEISRNVYRRRVAEYPAR